MERNGGVYGDTCRNVGSKNVGMMPVMDTAAQPSEERFAFLGVQGRSAPAEG